MREKKAFKYDILLYGFINKLAYPLRVKFFEILQFLNQRSNLRIKHIPHPGYYTGISNMPKNENLSKIINESRFTLVTSSKYQILLKKYMEVPMSGSTMIGDIPPDYPELNGKMIEINRNMTHDDIIKILKECFENKHVDIEKESRKYGVELSKRKNFKAGYELLNSIINK